MEKENITINPSLLLKIADLDVSIRALHCFNAQNISRLWQLAVKTKEETYKFRNFGKKCFTELDDLLKDHGLSYGMKFSDEEMAYLRSKTTDK